MPSLLQANNGKPSSMRFMAAMAFVMSITFLLIVLFVPNANDPDNCRHELIICAPAVVASAFLLLQESAMARVIAYVVIFILGFIVAVCSTCAPMSSGACGANFRWQ